MKTAIKTGETTSGAQATEDPDLLAANGRAAVREVEIEIARILEQGKKKRGEASKGSNRGQSLLSTLAFES
jgi:hypothetical protein